MDGDIPTMVEGRGSVSQAFPSLDADGAIGLAGVSTVARLKGFDLDERPLVSGIRGDPHRVVPARTTVRLRRAMIGCEVVVVFADGEHAAPIIVGVVDDRPPARADTPTTPASTVAVDRETLVIEAEREIVLRCGDASITLTRAGKVIIQGNYVVSRSTGHNRIKGAVVDIN